MAVRSSSGIEGAAYLTKWWRYESRKGRHVLGGGVCGYHAMWPSKRGDAGLAFEVGMGLPTYGAAPYGAPRVTYGAPTYPQQYVQHGTPVAQ